MSDTIWLPVPGASGYEVSNDERLRSRPRVILTVTGRKVRLRGKELRLSLDEGSKGYPRTVIRLDDGRRVTVGIHQVVCPAFHGAKPSPRHEVRHRNGNRGDNRPENLTWGTRSENMLDAVEHGTNPSTQRTHCPQGHPYDAENTYRKPSYPAARYCLKCSRDQAKLAARRRRAELRKERTNA